METKSTDSAVDVSHQEIVESPHRHNGDVVTHTPQASVDSAVTMATLTGEIIKAYLEKNHCHPGELPKLILDVRAAMSADFVSQKDVTQPEAPVAAEPPEQQPAVPIKKSVRADAIVCLECGREMKTLGHHLPAAHKVSFAEYAAKWRLPSDYPKSCHEYAEQHRKRTLQMIAAGKFGPRAANNPMSKHLGPGAAALVYGVPTTKKKPAVPIAESLTDDFVVCLECGDHAKQLSPHLMSRHKLNAAAYRKRWGLPTNYVLTAPNERLRLTAQKAKKT